MFYYYNEYLLDKPSYVLDQAVFYIAIVHVSYILFELVTQRFYENSGINIE